MRNWKILTFQVKHIYWKMVKQITQCPHRGRGRKMSSRSAVDRETATAIAVVENFRSKNFRTKVPTLFFNLDIFQALNDNIDCPLHWTSCFVDTLELQKIEPLFITKVFVNFVPSFHWIVLKMLLRKMFPKMYWICHGKSYPAVSGRPRWPLRPLGIFLAVPLIAVAVENFDRDEDAGQISG